METREIDAGVRMEHNLEGLLASNLFLSVLEPSIKKSEEVKCVGAIERDAPLLEADVFRVSAVANYQLHAGRCFELLH